MTIRLPADRITLSSEAPPVGTISRWRLTLFFFLGGLIFGVGLFAVSGSHLVNAMIRARSHLLGKPPTDDHDLRNAPTGGQRNESQS
jgi:hypothetical protein